ncbi:MAG: hypothetical protein PHE60_00710 [Sulfurospirillaceae bacterium]|nr:hypothetical protein [Sulfurospirillaceae bacterium]
MKLAAPGDGLPKFEKLFIKTFLVPCVKFVFSWESALRLLHKEVKAIENVVCKIKKDDLQKRVLINRIFGIEDNSRDFSVNMVLEHLVIVGNGIMRVIQTLSNEEEFTQDITIQGVKPHANNADTLNEFLIFIEKYDAFIKSLPKKKSIMTKKHPWFVEFNNFEWSAFMFIHTLVHRRQIEAISKNLAR